MARRCRYCKEELPAKKNCINVWQREGFCEIDCMTLHGLNKAEAAKKRKAEREAKAKRAKHRADKERIKTKADHAREAQAAFNAYIRERDRGLACISCGKMPNFKATIGGSGVQAGHYRSVGACPELRFEPLNVHVQCYRCNVQLSGAAIDYRIGLVKRIGQDAVDWIEGPHDPKRYTIDDLKQIKAEYRAKVRELKRSYTQ